MGPEPLISIVTPSFNQGAYIEQTIQSILEQSYTNVELLVMDGGSSDGTLSILKRYAADKRLRYVSEPDRGQSHAINKGLARAKGTIFNWINSDDYLEPGALAKVAKAFAEPIHLFSGKLRKFGEPGGETTGWYYLELEKIMEATLSLGRFCQPSTFWNTEVFRELGGVREDLHCAMDFQLWAKYLVRYGQKAVVRTEDVLANYREHLNSKSALLNKSFKEEINAIFLSLLEQMGAPELLCLAVAKETSRRCDDHWKISKDFNRDQFVALMAYQFARKSYYQRAYEEARELLGISWRSKPLFDAWRLKWKLAFKR